MPPKIVARLLRQVARAIGKAHQAGIVHRDLKPDNIFLVEAEDEDFTAKVLDFGIAKATGGIGGVGTSSKTRTGALLGTPYYMSPEQAQGTRVIDFRTDLWALAVITYECLAGKRPFDSEALGDLLLKICATAPPIPSQNGVTLAGFDGWFAKATQREPEDRFQTAGDMAKAFSALLDPSGIPSDSSMSSFGPLSSLGPAGDSLEGSEVTPARAAKQSRTVAVVGAAAGLVAIILLAIFLGRSGDASSHAAAPVATTATSHPVTAQPPAPAPEPAPAAAMPPAPSEEATPNSSAEASASTASHAKGQAAAKAKAAAPGKTGPAAAAPKKQEAFDPLMMRR
jgi:serine/threonine-protein kinase